MLIYIISSFEIKNLFLIKEDNKMCKEVEEYREKWRKLEESTTNLKKEIFGLACKVEGVIVAKEKDEVSKSWCEILDKMEVALNQIKVEVSEEEFEICIPEYFFRGKASVVGTFDFDVIGTMQILKTLKNGIISDEALILPGKESSYHNYGLATDLLRAISEFEDAFIEYME